MRLGDWVSLLYMVWENFHLHGKYWGDTAGLLGGIYPLAPPGFIYDRLDSKTEAILKLNIMKLNRIQFFYDR